MRRSQWVRVAPAGGVIFVLLFIAGWVLEGVGAPGTDTSRRDVLARYLGGGTELRHELGATLVGFAAFFFIVFLGSLRSTLRAAGGPGISSVAFGGGVVMIVLLLASSAVDVAFVSTIGYFDEYRADPDTPLLLASLGFWLEGYALVAGGVMVGATSVAALRASLLPRWFAITGLLLTAVAFFGESALIVVFPFFALMAWILVLSIVLATRELPRAAEPALETRIATSHNL